MHVVAQKRARYVSFEKGKKPKLLNLSHSRDPPNVPKTAMKGLQELVSGPDPKEQVKKWKAAMRGESRKIDRNIRGPVWRVNPLHIRKST
jgi:hypothetical protein